MHLWFTEYQTDDLGLTCKVTKVHHSEETPFQKLSLIETEQFGRVLTLDGIIQTTIADEFVYHEMITHVAMITHGNAKKVLVVGGGDGGAIREIIKHKSVEKVVLAEIDERVVEVSKEYLPEISCGLSDKRVEVVIADGIEYVKQNKNEFDVVIVDSTDPIGAAEGLFQEKFYKSIYECLKPDGIFVAQTESPFLNQDLIKSVYGAIRSIFPITRLYTCSTPTYQSGYWSFTMGSKKNDPLEVNENEIPELDTRYYCKEIHKSIFALPRFVQDLVK